MRFLKGPGGRGVLLCLAWLCLTHLLAEAAARLPFPVESPWSSGLAKGPALARFDAGWYGSIAESGYSMDPAGGQSNVAFFPLYPLLIRALTATGISFAHAGLAISFVALLSAARLLAKAEGNAALDGLGAIVALLAWPASFFLASVYTESLFLALALVAFRSAEGRKWGPAALAGFLAGLARPNGFLVTLLVAPQAFAEWQRGPRTTGTAWKAVATALAPIAGLATFLSFLWIRFGDPLACFRALSAWGRVPGQSGAHLLGRIRDMAERLLGIQAGYGLVEALELGTVALFAVLTLLLFRARRLSEGLYSAGVLSVAVLNGSLAGAHRYVLVLFPCFALLGELLGRSRTALVLYVFMGAGLGVTLLTRFVLWVFVG